MTDIEIKNCVYKVHPIYDLHASDADGNIIHIIKKVPMKGNKNYNGYIKCNVKKHGDKQKSYYIHRFVWECFNGFIPDGKEIDHINNNKEDNRLCNLQLLTHRQNCNKFTKDRDYSFVAQNHKNRKCIKATNKSTNEVTYFKSMYAVNQHLQINAGVVKIICDGTHNYKSSISKKDGHSYTFDYVKQTDLPNNHKKSANIRPKRVSDEDKKKQQIKAANKWRNKEFKCIGCDKVYKNSYKCLHKKHCQKSQKQ